MRRYRLQSLSLQSEENQGDKRERGMQEEARTQSDGDQQQVVHLLLLLARFTLPDQFFQIVQEPLVVLLEGLDQASHQRNRFILVLFEQEANGFSDCPFFEFLLAEPGRVDKRPPLLDAVEQSLFMQAVQCGHDRGIGEPTIQLLMNKSN